MKKLLPFVSALLMATALTAQIGPPVTSPYLDSCFLTYMETNHIPGIATCMVKDGLIRWIGTYGDANIEQEIPVDTSTLFFLASVSKTFTVTALMQLWEEDFFELDDDINEYLDFDVRNPNDTLTPITFRMLCTHTSSIRDNWSNMPFYWTGDSPIPLGEYLFDYLDPDGDLYDPDLHFFDETPGTDYHYCNIGTALLGYLIEELVDTSFSVLTQEMLFEPLQMNETSWFLEGLNTTNMAMPYHWNGSDYVPYGHFGFSFYPAGQLRTSIDQIGKFLLCYLNEGTYQGQQILQSSTIDSILSPQIPSIDPNQGLIWFSGQAVGSTWWGHGGDTYGVKTFMFFSPEYDYGHIILSNGETDIGPLGYILYDFAIDSLETTCLAEGITFSTQAEIDSFAINYPYCTEIEGDVIIQGDDITNLNGLDTISSIGGNLTFWYTAGLTSLAGLENLTSINGSLALTGNEVLSDITGLQNLIQIGDNIIIGSQFQPAMPPPIGGNPMLSSFEGLNGITSIDGMLYIRANEGLTSLSGLENLSTIGGSLMVINNDSLPGFEGLGSLTTIGGSLKIFNNESLVSFSGLDSLSSIDGSLTIGSYVSMIGSGSNPALASLAGLENLTSIGGEFEIINNESLTTLLNLQSVEPGSIESITIKDNVSLSGCHAEAVCAYLQSSNPVVEIHDNAPGCNSQEEVEEACNPVSVEQICSGETFTIVPNPLASKAVVSYTLQEDSHISLIILDLSGRLVVTLVDVNQQQGAHEMRVNTTGIPAGVYFCKLRTNTGIQTTKLIKL